MKTFFFTTLALSISVFSFVSILPTNAQSLPCENIIAPENIYQLDSPIRSKPITNCADPFNAEPTAQSYSSPYTFKINGVVVGAGETVEVPAGGTTNYVVTGRPIFSFEAWYRFYLHDGNNYRDVDIQPFYYTEQQYRDAAAAFFATDVDREPYIQEALNQARGNDYGDHPDEFWPLFYEYTDYVDSDVMREKGPLRAGTYTLVFEETVIVLNKSNIFERLFAFLIATAHAQFIPNNIFTLTFTVAETPQEPQGASSVLFLPGIQASRLYLGEDGVGGLANERVWEPGNNNDVRALEMTSVGESVQKLYSSDILKTITTDLLFGYTHESGSVYKDFSDFMDGLVTDQAIREWYPFAYDWRYDVFDVVKNGSVINQAGARQYPVTVAQELALRSKSGKVTIIAHSNGGLLAKALMIELEKINKESLVDKIVFLGTPQLGTPKALGTILHGYDQQQGGGFVINDTTARTVLNNFPGAYALLPSATYLNQTDTPVVSFDNSASTALYRTSYGTSITNLSTYASFLNGTAAENRSLSGKIYQPASANSSLLATALSNHANLLDSWVAPSSTKVVSIIGTGIPTMKALRYEDVVENICPTNTIFSTLSLCAVERLPRPFAVMTYFGDKTVTGLSAKGYAGMADKYFVDLNKISNEVEDVFYDHANFTEVSYVQTLLESLISTTTVPTIPFIINQEPVVIEPYIVQQIASPVYMSSIDNNGRVSGYIQQNGTWVLKEDIPGSQYFEFAGVKYLLIPLNTDFKTTLSGQEFGGYTYKISELKNDDTQITLSQLVNATTTPTMTATLEMTNGQFSTIKTDYNGDTVIDNEVTVNGIVVTLQPPYTYQKLINTIQALSIKKSQKDALLFLAREAEKLDIKSTSSPLAGKLEKVTLKVLETTIQFYLKSRLLTPVQAEELLKIVKFLSQ